MSNTRETVAYMPRMTYRLPPGAWDSHVHVVDEERFPFHPDHPYRPKKANLDDLLNFEKSLGIDHVCIICMSVYGDDNRSILDALHRLNGRGRAVVCIDPINTSDGELQTMHHLGARGVRLNIKTRDTRMSKDQFSNVLRTYADKIRPFGWVLQIYLSLPQLTLIAEEIPKLGVPVVIDHLGHPDTRADPRRQSGYSEIMSLLAKKQVWIKLSGTYRFSQLPALETYARDVLKTAPTQIVWASDWPHSGSVENNPNGDRHIHQDYRRVDDTAFVKQCMDWCDGDEELIWRIWVDNPRRLWQYPEEQAYLDSTDCRL